MGVRTTTSRFALDAGARRLLLIVAVLLLVPLFAALFTDHERRSQWERRSLAEPPGALRDLRSWFDQWDAAINDHLAFFVGLNRGYRWVRFHVLGDDPIPGVSRAGEGVIFLNAMQADQRLHLIEDACAGQEANNTARRTLRAMHCLDEALGARGSRVVFGFAPTKPVVYPDLLPASIPTALRQSCKDFPVSGSMAAELADQAGYDGLQTWFPLAAFRAQRDGERFYPLDNFHWKGESALLFTQGLATSLSLEARLTDKISRSKAESLSDFSFVGIDLATRHWAYQYPQQISVQDIAAELGARSRSSRRFVNQDVVDGRTALLLSDSFGEDLAEHLAAYYHALDHVDYVSIVPQDLEALLDFLARHEWDDIIFIHQHRVIPQMGRLRRLAGALGSHPGLLDKDDHPSCSVEGY